MGKLYEVLAVEGDAQSRAVKLLAETKATFANKENLFKGKSRKLSLFDQAPEREVEIKALEAKDSTNIKVEATVPDSLNYLANVQADYWDVMYQKEATNQLAKADVIAVDGSILLTGVPVTFLLCMENRLKDLRPVLEAIPTLAPGVSWSADDAYGAYICKAPETSDVKTKEDVDHRVIVPVTGNVPAQVATIKVTTNIGKYTTNEWSGLISSAQKAHLLADFDALYGAIKQARQRANAAEVVTDKVGAVLARALLKNWFNPATMNPLVQK